MKQILCHCVPINSNIDFAFGLGSFVCDLIGYSKLQTGIKIVEHIFRLVILERRDDFCLSGEQSQKDVDFIILIRGRCKHVVVIAILVNFILEGHRLSQLDIFDPRVNSQCPVQLLNIRIIPHYMELAVIPICGIIELLFLTITQLAPLEYLVY